MNYVSINKTIKINCEYINTPYHSLCNFILRTYNVFYLHGESNLFIVEIDLTYRGYINYLGVCRRLVQKRYLAHTV